MRKRTEEEVLKEMRESELLETKPWQAAFYGVTRKGGQHSSVKPTSFYVGLFVCWVFFFSLLAFFFVWIIGRLA